MSKARTGTVTSAIVAAAFAVSISGTAVAAGKTQGQSGGTTPPSNVTTTTNGSTSNNIGTWAAVRALQVYQKCKDNILPECPSN